VAHCEYAGFGPAPEGLQFPCGAGRVIWKHRNSCVFNDVSPSVLAVLQMAREEALLWTVAGAKGLSMLQAVGAVGV
jgi:hypothetical protein